MAENDDQVNGFAKNLDAGPSLSDRVGEFELRDLRRQHHAARIETDHADHRQPYAISFEQGVRSAEAVPGVLVANVATDDRKRHPGRLAVEDLPAVVELVVADPHRVVAHQGHQLHQRFAAGQIGEGAGEHVARIEQERCPRRRPLPFDQGREMRGASQLGRAGAPIRGDRLERTVKVVGVEQSERMLAAAELADLAPGLAERGARRKWCEAGELEEPSAVDRGHGARSFW